jgi:hypothetical protein
VPALFLTESGVEKRSSVTGTSTLNFEHAQILMRTFYFVPPIYTRAVYEASVMISTTMARARERSDMLKATAKISARQIAVLIDISPTVLGNAFGGVTYMGADKEKELAEVTLNLMLIEDSIRPLRLPENTDSLRKLLNFVKDHGIELETIRTSIQSLFGEVE